MKYFVVWRSRNNKQSNYEISNSRNAMKHLEEKDAQTVWVYDKDGWWLSFADRDQNGKPYRPQMCPDGEPRKYYAEKFKELNCGGQ